MKYEDVRKILGELYIMNYDKEMEHIDKFCEYTHEANDAAKYHENEAIAYHAKNEQLLALYRRFKELAKQTGENKDSQEE